MASTAPSFEQRKAWQIRPEQKPVMYQSWQKLLFLHWKYDPAEIQNHLPQGLTVDTYQGDAWVGIVPFYMRNIRPAWSPAVPYISNFLELNVRTYVYDKDGNPGVWFLSLDASRLLAVLVARSTFHLPYFWAKMSAYEDETGIHYQSRRFSDSQRRTSEFHYRGVKSAAPAKDGTLEFFLVERYLLFSQPSPTTLAIGQVYHPPYQVQPVELTSYDESVLELNGIPTPNRPPDHALYAERVDVEVFPIQQAWLFPPSP